MRMRTRLASTLIAATFALTLGGAVRAAPTLELAWVATNGGPPGGGSGPFPGDVVTVEIRVHSDARLRVPVEQRDPARRVTIDNASTYAG